ncbi:bifunctional tetrahydrofolate synthase/dihydrofolate synthase [Undibacterium fentianense]|uniref:Dihydrofolate synthase/folylpolyglutamate synthase n=1 Tax=Undibacterium fentianense TaxID=2828728 RepID=A0A941E2W0_9BURK|nr:bifunctional tetrahydrofolate synthase/dihydrofolate synthase [Undibacterium fentianense]MBR7798703.1 bifunctional tetrahydrofolate synthase/dihydrofolate synthase [Undibacterium fentianense]
MTSPTHSALAPTKLADWLSLLETRHSKEIDMGLERVMKVKNALDLQYSCPVIMVAGTNGKGSTCAMLESIFIQAGYRVGLYSKPHFLDFNERARVNGVPLDDESFVKAFDVVEAARKEISLTYFEFTTLAICKLLADAPLDVVILEVGLGGRLDAVNVIDADVSIVTSVDIDHVDYLGDTREKIGFEKAGIFRQGKVAICSDPQAPQSLIDHALAIGADLRLFGRDFNYNGDKQQWNFGGREQRRNSLAYPSLRGANQLLNASAVLAALEALRDQLPVGAQEVRTGLVMVDLPGRFQVLPGRPTVVLDVAHNPHAAATLSQNLDNMGFHAYTYAIFGSMLDKDILGVIAHMAGKIDHWCLCDLPLPRAASSDQLLNYLHDANVTEDKDHSLHQFKSPEDAYMFAMSKAGENDRIVVFGSFLTVAGVMRARRNAQS